VDLCIIVQFRKKKIQQDATISQIFIIPYLYEAQHVLEDTAPHQEPKTALEASGCQCSFRLLMMGGVSPKTW
jgi:hypothetical protein